MKLKRLSSLASASVLSVSALFNLAFVPVAHALADTCTWTGAGSDNNFSTAANWTGCDNGNVPEAGDTLRFNTVPATQESLTNDLGVAFAGITSVAIQSSNYNAYVIDTISFMAGASVSVTPGSTCAESNLATLQFGTINAAGNLDLASHVTPMGNAVINVSGNLTIHTDFFPAGAGSSVTGGVVVGPRTATTTAQNCSGGAGGPSNGLNITGFTVNSLTVQKGASVSLGSQSFPITLGGGSGTGAPELVFTADYVTNAYIPTTFNLTSPITILDDSVVYVGQMTTVNITGALTGSGKKITKNVYSEGTLNINPSSNNSATEIGTLKNPQKTTTISDSQAVSATVVENEVTILDGTRDYVTVLAGGTLKGTGTASSGLYVNAGGTLAPGHSPGCMNSGAFNLVGTYQAEIGGTTACSGYDQMKVTGAVDVTNGTLEAVLYNGFVPTVGQSYTIIDNDGADAVTGTFSGIAEGGSYTSQGVTYSVTYKGGDGNDVVLTVTAIDASQLPAAPNTGFKLLTSSPILTLLATTAAAGAILLAHKRMQKTASKRR